jgi:hypothetical protein
MAKLEGFKLEAGKLYAVGIGTKKKPVKTFYDVDMDQWYIRFGDAPWNHLGEFIEQNPGIEIDEIDEQGNQVASDESAQIAPEQLGQVVDVMPVVVAAEVSAVTGTEAPAWME